MPRKRSIEVREAEATDKLDRIRLEKSIRDLKEKMRVRRPARRRVRR